ncbi:MAG TPA: replication-associated recombination protein A [Bacteroidetes bacterium]|nr:replication-associated recombination protein A [Bacteroidota bacterium]
MDLFADHSHKAPLAERIRPRTLEHYIGQKHILQEGSPLHNAIRFQRLPSMIFWGPPGVGKTTLAQIIANSLERPFRQLSAIQSGVKEVREVLKFAGSRPGTILFIDEIHRFNKSQQDSLLGAVEKGLILLIGATTENPSFEVNSALLSRCQIYRLEPLKQDEVRELLEYAIKNDDVLASREIELRELDVLYKLSGGDARKSLNLLEIYVDVHEDPVILLDDEIMKVAQARVARYDKGGEQHYDIISAFIKSIRGGDPNAAIYWLARMLDGGEDVKFIARRLIISASEDIGNANPNALLLANSCFEAVSKIGMPEARIILAQATTYLATSAKSNAAYVSINKALKFVKENPDFPIPLHLRNAPTKYMRDSGYGKGYKYSHEYAGREGNQEYLPEGMIGTAFYQPKEVGREKEICHFIQQKWGEKYQKHK